MNPFLVALKDKPDPRTRRRKGNYVERLPRTPKGSSAQERDDPLHDRDNAFMSTMPGTIQVEEHHKPERDTGKMMVGKKGFEKQPRRVLRGGGRQGEEREASHEEPHALFIGEMGARQ